MSRMQAIDQNEVEIEKALNGVLFNHALSAWAISILAGLVSAGFLYEKVEYQSLLYWTVSMLLLSFMRLSIAVSARQNPDANLPVNRYMAIIGLNGICWSTLAFLWTPELPLTTQMFILITPFALCAGSVFSFGANLWAYRIFALCLLVPSSIILILLSDGVFFPFVGPILFFTVAILALSKQFHSYLRETIELRIRNQGLVNDLSSQNDSLRNARDEAQNALVTKEEFLARMSHELRTPMNGVLGMSRQLTKTNLDDKQRHLVSTLQQSGEAMLSMVGDLLDASSMASGKTQLEYEAYNIRENLELVIAQYSRSLSERPITIKSKIDQLVPLFIMGDAQRMTQLVSKLVDNAIKFTAEGEVLIRVSAENIEQAVLGAKSSGDLVITVSDTGAGIERSELSKVRELFHQVEGNAARRYGGSGLGLTLVQGLTDLMGGRFELDSQVGVGTQATIVVPMLEAELPEQVPCNNVPVVKDNAMPIGLSDHNQQIAKRVLVAEDNPVNQLVIESILEDLGCDVALAENGLEAVEMLGEEQYDIVFMDCQMPEMDGYEATRKAREGGHQLPIVAVTANTLAGDRTLCMDAGMNDYLPKPITDEMLRVMLNKWIGGQPSQLAC